MTFHDLTFDFTFSVTQTYFGEEKSSMFRRLLNDFLGLSDVARAGGVFPLVHLGLILQQSSAFWLRH